MLENKDGGYSHPHVYNIILLLLIKIPLVSLLIAVAPLAFDEEGKLNIAYIFRLI